MGILSVVHRNLLSNAKSQPKYLSSSSNLWFMRRISSPAVLSKKAQSPHALTGDLKSNNKLMLLIEHLYEEPGEDFYKGCSQFLPYNYSLISAENSWKDHQNFCNPFSGYGNYEIAGSINELMLILLYNVDAPLTRYGKYLLWNPITDTIKILPPPGPAVGPSFTNSHGFGFDSQSHDYKVIRSPLYRYADDEDKDIHFKLYSLKTNSWKKITYPSFFEEEPFPTQPAFHVNGVCYWKATIRTSAVILSFDFANEKFSCAPHIPRPPRLHEQRKGSICDYGNDFVLVEFDGSLAAVVYVVYSKLGDTEEEALSFEVWGWNGESWLQRMSRITIIVPDGVDKVIGLFQNDKLLLHDCNHKELMLFDLAESKLVKLGIRADLVNIFPFMPGAPIPFMGNK